MGTQSTKWITTQAGHRLAVSRREGDGTPVLFLSSIAANHTMWDGVRARLSRPSIAFDTRGHGASDVTSGRVSLADLAHDTLAVMDATETDRAILCGLSLGGAVVMQVAADAPERVAGLVLANTATSFGTPARWQERADALRAGGLPDMVQPTLERWLTEAWRRDNPEATQMIADMVKSVPPEGYAAACAALGEADMTAALSNWAGPTLIIAGAHDRSTPPERAQEMQEMAAQAELVILDTAHISAVEDPGGFSAALEAFAANVEKTHG